MDDMGGGERGRSTRARSRSSPRRRRASADARHTELDRRARPGAAHNWNWLVGVGVVAVILGIVVASHAFGSLHAPHLAQRALPRLLGVAQLLTVGRGGDRRAHLISALVALDPAASCSSSGRERHSRWSPWSPVSRSSSGEACARPAFGRPHETRESRPHRRCCPDRARHRHDRLAGGDVTLVGLLIGIAAIVWGVTTIAAGLRLRRAGLHWKNVLQVSSRWLSRRPSPAEPHGAPGA